MDGSGASRRSMSPVQYFHGDRLRTVESIDRLMDIGKPVGAGGCRGRGGSVTIRSTRI